MDKDDQVSLIATISNLIDQIEEMQSEKAQEACQRLKEARVLLAEDLEEKEGGEE